MGRQKLDVYTEWKELAGSETAARSYSDVEMLSDPVYVQEVYIMDGFMRALAEFRTPQDEDQVTVSIPCVENEALENVKRRLFEHARENFVALQELSSREKEAYGYKWITKFFGPDWTEADLKWFVYQNYDMFLDPSMWKFYGPDLANPVELFDEVRVKRAKEAILKYKKGHAVEKAGAQPTSINAIYLLPTHLRVMLFREGYQKLMYTLPRETTFETLKTLVESDLGLAAGAFNNFDCGPPGNKFGPGKSFDDVFPPTTVGISHAWA